MRYILLFTVFASCCSVGIMKSHALKKRCASLSEFVAFLDFAETLLKTENLPTADICRLSGFSLFDGTEPVSDAEKFFRSACDENFSRMCFDPSDGHLLDTFCSEFGKSDGDGQSSLIASVRQSAEKALENASSEKEKYSRAYAAFGFLAGAALVIILI